MEIAQYSAAQLFVCFGGEGSREYERRRAGGAAAPADGAEAAGGAAAAGGAQEAAAGGALFDTDALQVWILKGCQQQLKGGLRDKPGKPPDYYHTAYCLSGLSAAQSAPGGAGVLGARSNELARASPLLNIVEEKVREAAAHFGALPQL